MEPPVLSFHYVRDVDSDNIDVGNVDANFDPSTSLINLSPSFPVEARQSLYGDIDEMEVDDFDHGNFDASDNMDKIFPAYSSSS